MVVVVAAGAVVAGQGVKVLGLTTTHRSDGLEGRVALVRLIAVFFENGVLGE